MMSNQETIFITATSPGNQDPLPVHYDPKGLPTDVDGETFILSDGVSLESAIYIVETDGSPWLNSAGQLVESIPVTKVPEEPEPGDE